MTQTFYRRQFASMTTESLLTNTMVDTIVRPLLIITTSATRPAPGTMTVPATAGATPQGTTLSPLRSPRQSTHHSDSRTFSCPG